MDTAAPYRTRDEARAWMTQAAVQARAEAIAITKRARAAQRQRLERRRAHIKRRLAYHETEIARLSGEATKVALLLEDLH